MRDSIECESHRGWFWFDGIGCCPECACGAACLTFSAQEGPAPEIPAGVDATLAERGARYGDFTEHAKITDALLGVMMGDSLAGRFATSWDRMQPFQRQALRTICDKLARIANGDPDYIDNWHDVQGYAKLVEDRLTK